MDIPKGYVEKFGMLILLDLICSYTFEKVIISLLAKYF